jgi:hypothetical protein
MGDPASRPASKRPKRGLCESRELRRHHHGESCVCCVVAHRIEFQTLCCLQARYHGGCRCGASAESSADMEMAQSLQSRRVTTLTPTLTVLEPLSTRLAHGVSDLLNSASSLPVSWPPLSKHPEPQTTEPSREILGIVSLPYHRNHRNHDLLSTIFVAPFLICPCTPAAPPYLRIVSNSHHLHSSCLVSRSELLLLQAPGNLRQLPRFASRVPLLQAKASSDQFPLQAIDNNLAHERHITQLGCA